MFRASYVRHQEDDLCRGADKSLVQPGRKQATVTEESGIHISYLLS